VSFSARSAGTRRATTWPCWTIASRRSPPWRPGARWSTETCARARPIAPWRRFLASHEGAWDDGDENLVRGYLDRWIPQGDDPLVAAAGGLSEAAVALAGLRARPETLWFFLWEMESMLAAVADNPGRPC